MKGMKQLGAIVGAIFLIAVLTATQSAMGQEATTKTAESKPAPTSRPDRRVTKHGWFPLRVRNAPAPKLPREIERVFVIPIRDRDNGITETTYRAIKNKVTLCLREKAQLVIFDMNTPGGSVAAMQDIVSLITGELNDVYTVAYVRNEAISAGAIISLACDEIIMTSTGKIGDAMPIRGDGVPISKELRGKIESYLRSDLHLLVERIGHDKTLCDAMITMTQRVWLVRNPETRELKLVNPDINNWMARIAGAPGATGRRPSLTDSVWEFVKEIDGSGGLFTPTASGAVEVGLVDLIIDAPKNDPFAGLKKHYNITGEPVILEDTWSESLVAFLTSPTIATILMGLGVLCVYAELKMPGFGIAGTAAVACFALLFGSHFLIGMANWWEIGLFVLGLTLIALEVFVIPGFGVAGITGILCCIIGLLAAIGVPNAPTEFPWPQTALQWSWFSTAIYVVTLGFSGGVIGAIILAQYMPRLPITRRMVLGEAQAATDAPATDDAPIMHIKVGDTGTVATICRPVGQVRFGNELCDATSEGATIETGAQVRVVERTGNQLIVKEV